MDKPTGSFVAMITPFNLDGTVDCGGFRTLLGGMGTVLAERRKHSALES